MFKRKLFTGAAALATLAGFSAATPANAGADAYIGEITWVAFTFCPRATLELDGQLLPIASFEALFSLIGTIYGGDGQTTFALPDMRGRTPLHTGQGPGLSNRTQGERSGAETNTMTVAQLPAHSHSATSTSTSASTTALRASSEIGDNAAPTNNVLADGRTARIYRSGVEADVDMDPSSVGGTSTTTNTTTTLANTGGNQPQDNMQPFLTIRACMVTEGIYPPRN